MNDKGAGRACPEEGQDFLLLPQAQKGRDSGRSGQKFQVSSKEEAEAGPRLGWKLETPN
jgi:hypothetical protein